MVSKKTRIASVVAASALVLGGVAIPTYLAYGEPSIVVPTGAIELSDYDFTVRLHPDFPQVVDYRLGDAQIAGRLGGALSSVEVNGVARPVTVEAPIVANDGKSATYDVAVPALSGVRFTVRIEVSDATLRMDIASLVDPEGAVDTLRIPNHDLVTLSSSDSSSQLTSARLADGSTEASDSMQLIAEADAGSVQESALILANTSSLAVAFDTNAVRATANDSWQSQIREADGATLGSVWAGAWTDIAEGATAYVEVKVTADANGDGSVDWQDAAVAARDILEFDNGAEETANQVIMRPTATGERFASLLAETERLSRATDNLGQAVVLTGIEGGDYDEAGGLAALETLSDDGVALNTTFGFDVSDAAVDPSLVERYQSLWDEGPLNVDSLYADDALISADSLRASRALQEQGWVVATHPEANPAAGSDVLRFVYNSTRDGWDDHPVLLTAAPATGSGDVLLDDVWQRTLPAKFLQRSEITHWDDAEVEFANGSVASAGEIELEGAVVYRDGAYLLPWCDGGTGWNDAGPKRLYHFNPDGGESSWQLPATCREALEGSLTVFKLVDDDRVRVGQIDPVNGSVTLAARAGVAYVLYPSSSAPAYENRAPSDFTVDDATAVAGTPVTITVETTDPEEGDLLYSAVGLPAGLTMGALGVISGTPTAAGTFEVTVTATDGDGAQASASFSITVTPAATTPPTTPAPTTPAPTTPAPTTPAPTTPAPGSNFVRTAPYTLPGFHTVNDRDWNTVCEPYSQTERCRTDIWASVVKRTGDTYSIQRGWAFNNLTYLPYMSRAQWANNPLGYDNAWTAADGAQWRTECDTSATGSNACRSYRMTTVYHATPKAGGGYTFAQENMWVFNNIVMFRTR